MTISRTWEVEDLARVAYTAYEQAVRAALPGHQGIDMPLFSELSPSLQEVWRHVAITVWSEIWTNSAPPIVALPIAPPPSNIGDRRELLARLLEKMRDEKPKRLKK